MRYINWDEWCIFILISFSVIYDLKNYRIPNILIGIGVLISLLPHLLQLNFSGILFWGFGIMTPILILLPLFLWGVLGAGDIKLFSVIGSFLGVSTTISVIGISFLIGGILSIFHMILFQSFFIRIHYFLSYISDFIQTKQYKPYSPDILPERGSIIHFTVAIFGGTVITIWNHL